MMYAQTIWRMDLNNCFKVKLKSGGISMKVQRFILSSFIGVSLLLNSSIVFAEDDVTTTSTEHLTTTTSTKEKEGTLESEVTESSSKEIQKESEMSTPKETNESTTKENSTEQSTIKDQKKPEVKEQSDKEISYQISRTLSGAEFFNLLSKDARKIAAENDLYASVMLAQAALESGFGSSSLSLAPHYNLFGVKGTYKGQSVSMATLEEENGQMYGIQAGFRAYPSYKESMMDYAALLSGGISDNPQFYQGTWKSKTSSYKEATKFLTGRYATDSQYATKLNGIIEAYGLTQFDNDSGEGKIEAVYREKVHVVEEDDTLDDLVRDYDVTFEELRRWNESLEKSDEIKPGEAIVIGKRKLKRHVLNESITNSPHGYQLPLKESYQISSSFGEQRTGEVHYGIDLAVPTGTLVGSVKEGLVVQTGYDPSAGNYVIIKHSDGHYSHYFHLNKIDTMIGAEVQTGDTIGRVGSTGNSTGPHLHFAIGKQPWREFIDPSRLLKF